MRAGHFYMQDSLSAYQNFLSDRKIPLPSLHAVLGSGFGAALGGLGRRWEPLGDREFSEIPGLPVSTVPDHAGRYRFFRHAPTGKVICFQMGRVHGYEGHEASAVVRTVMIPRLAGVRDFLLTNAAGGLSHAYRSGDVMLIRDHVNLTGKNPLTGANPSFGGKEIGPRFPDLCGLYDRDWRERLGRHAAAQGLHVHEGTYLGILGPSFETPAEVSLFASWNLQAVGMSTVWEAIALRHSGARVAGMSLISNLGAGMADQHLDHLAIIETCRAAASRIVAAVAADAEEEFGA